MLKKLIMLAIIALLNKGSRASLQGIIRFLKTKIAPINSNTEDCVRAEYRAYLSAAEHGTIDL